ncbi:hypothetical protein F2Q68_00030906 [Brassica cretica]|uniref:Uncharacterized protein n=1 Tax=Brassica cretica TaxID=69181 RepID=A0A8S9GEG8_BRACR|nr:hypothetical protein F2Q68_00030906 [Brassica cretica]
MEDVSNARVTVSTPPDVELYSRELNATGGAVVSPEIYAAKVWIAAITTHLLCDLHPCPCDNVSLQTFAYRRILMECGGPEMFGLAMHIILSYIRMRRMQGGLAE